MRTWLRRWACRLLGHRWEVAGWREGADPMHDFDPYVWGCARCGATAAGLREAMRADGY